MDSKTKTMALMIIFLFVVSIAGCAPKQAETAGNEQAAQEPAAAEEKPVTSQTKIEVEEPAGPVLSDDLKAEFETKLLSNKIYLKPTFVRTSVGKEQVFWVGLSNFLAKESNFKIEILFEDARDSMNGQIEVSEEIANTWVSSELIDNEFTLKPYEILIKPITINVGKTIMTGLPTKPGSYYFSVKSYYKEPDTKYKYDYETSKQIALKIDE